MQIFTLLNITTYLFLTFNSPTTFKFDSQIEFTTISNESDFYKYESKDRKHIVLKPLKDNIDTNVVVITKNGSYTFSLHVNNQKSPLMYQILDGEIGESFYKIKETSDFELLTSEKVSLVRVKNNKIKSVNDLPARTEQYVAKNAKVKIDGEFIN